MDLIYIRYDGKEVKRLQRADGNDKSYMMKYDLSISACTRSPFAYFSLFNDRYKNV